MPDELEVIEATAKGVLGDPLRDIVMKYGDGTFTQIGRISEDYFRIVREKHLCYLREGLAKFLGGRKLKRPLSDKLLLTCLIAASAEDSDVLKDWFAVLLVNAGTRTDDDERYQVFADTLARLPARHAAALVDAYRSYRVRYAEAEAEHSRGSFEEFVPFIPIDDFLPEEGRRFVLSHLQRLGLVEFVQDSGVVASYFFTDDTFEFMDACLPPQT